MIRQREYRKDCPAGRPRPKPNQNSNWGESVGPQTPAGAGEMGQAYPGNSQGYPGGNLNQIYPGNNQQGYPGVGQGEQFDGRGTS